MIYLLDRNVHFDFSNLNNVVFHIFFHIAWSIIIDITLLQEIWWKCFEELWLNWFNTSTSASHGFNHRTSHMQSSITERCRLLWCPSWEYRFAVFLVSGKRKWNRHKAIPCLMTCVVQTHRSVRCRFLPGPPQGTKHI